MTPVKEPEVFDNAYRLYQSGQYQQAYDLLTAAMDNYPDRKMNFYFWRMCLAARLPDLQLAEGLLKSALDEGVFFSETTLRKDEDLKGLQGRPVFEAQTARSLEMLSEAQERALPGLTLLEPVETRYDHIPLLMALHGNNSNAERFQGYWNNMSEKGWLVAIPQSSQVGGNGVFTWNDPAIAKKEIGDHFNEMDKKISIDPKKRIIAGFSKGGYTAVRAALLQYFPVHGFIAVAPHIPDVHEMENYVAEGKASRLRGYFLLGQEDEMCTPNAVLLQESLLRLGIPCGLEIFPGIAHDFPKDYHAAIDRALRFILQE